MVYFRFAPEGYLGSHSKVLGKYVNPKKGKKVSFFNDKNITMIIIAHRRSALEIADKIYRFENSVITDVTHEIKNTR